MAYRKIDRNAIDKEYEIAKEMYAAFGVDTDAVIEKMKNFEISLNCWQGDDVGGFEKGDQLATGGLMATGNFAGRATTPKMLRDDIEEVLKQLPGQKKVAIHAMYSESEDGSPVGRNDITTKHFEKWVNWAKELGIGIDFNHTFFGHPMADSGYTLSSPDDEIRNFWIEHAKKCREIAAWIGRETGKTCVNNLWVPDGGKDVTVNRMLYRANLKNSLDEIFSVKYDEKETVDAIESKLFGIGAEAYTVGSNEFYVAYGVANQIPITFDMGHFHPTESVADKISAALLFDEKLLIHLSRGVRWDSDHAPTLTNEVTDLMQEINRADAWDRVYMALDFFDPSVNRLIAWVMGARTSIKGAMIAMLEPTELLQKYELEENYSDRLGLLEEMKMMPFGAVWNKFCVEEGVAPGYEWIDEIKAYTDRVFPERA